jgi:AcrR family transcriptional regulator
MPATNDPIIPGGKRERTRATLIAATLDVVADKGFAGASLDAIAARAGMTKGAIYSNFAGKGELMMAAMGAKGLSLNPTEPWGETVREGLYGIAREVAVMIRRARDEARFAVEFQLYAMGDAELRAELAKTYAGVFAGSGDFFARFSDLKPGVDPRTVAVALQSVSMGLLVQSFITPDEITEAVVVATITALADGLTVAPEG